MILSVDGGGSNLRLLLAEEDLTVVNLVQYAGVNTLFIPETTVKSTIEEAVARCVPGGAELSAVCYSMLGPKEHLVEAVGRRARVRSFQPLHEGDMGLLAGAGRAQGFVALSGTGSDVFFSGDGLYEAIGGWGMLLGDEGSGFEIGQKGLRAAIHMSDGRAEPGLLLDLLLERWHIERESLFSALIARIHGSPAARGEVAAFAPVVGEAARRGDSAAVAIFRQAGEDLALLMNTLIAKVAAQGRDVTQYPVTLCGGAWKASYAMFSAFRRAVLERSPGMAILWPMFDAVVGGLLHAAVRGGMEPSAAVARLKQTCAGLMYQKPEDWNE